MCTSVVTVHMCIVMVGLLSTGVTRHSVASETSSDYALPPDDDDLPRRTDSSDTSEPEHKLLKCTNAVSLKKVNVQINFFYVWHQPSSPYQCCCVQKVIPSQL